MTAISNRRPGLRLAGRALAFLALFAALDVAYLGLKEPWLKPLVIDRLTVRPAAWAADALLAVPVQSDRHLLLAGGRRISVLNGCEGVDAMLLLLAAIVVAPIRWPHKLWGAGLGLPLVYAANQARIVALVWARLEAPPAAFALGHGLLGPLAVTAVAGLYFLCWSEACPRR
jgi:exosortase/archaeosortase family protein